MKDIVNDIQQTLHYFDYFRHPLTEKEVWKFCSKEYTSSQVKSALSFGLKNDVFVGANGFFGLKGREEILAERKEHAKLNYDLLAKAKWVVRLLRLLPFIEAIGISGSLSKLGAKPDADIDFFLITKKDRVWFVKAISIVLKRFFFLNSHKYLCVNYIISSQDLKLPKQNRFQALEAITIRPMFGEEIFEKFYHENNWISDFYPNAFPPETKGIGNRMTLVARLSAWIFRGSLGGQLEQMARYEFRKHGLKRLVQNRSARMDYEEGMAAYFPHDMEKEVLDHYKSSKVDLTK